MKKLLLGFLFLTTCGAFTTINAQTIETPTKASNQLFYTELGGPGVLFSANYDGRFKNTSNRGLGYRVGVGFSTYEKQLYTSTSPGNYYYSSTTTSFITIPLGLNYVLEKEGSANMFEIGAGVTVLTKKVSVFNYEEGKEGNIVGSFSFMYRRQPIDGGFSWRIGFTPIIGTSGDIVPSAAVGIGYSF